MRIETTRYQDNANARSELLRYAGFVLPYARAPPDPTLLTNTPGLTPRIA